MRSKLLLTAMLCLLVGCDSKKDDAASADETSKPEGTTAAAARAPERDESDQPKPTRDGPKSTAFDFMANRHLAHVWDGALIVDLGHPAALKYVADRERSGWSDAFETEEGLAVYIDGTEGSLRVPLHPPKTAEVDAWKLSIRMRPIGRQRCDFFLTPAGGVETRAATLEEVEPGWNVHTVDLEGVEAGAEHRVRIACSKARRADKDVESAAAVDWLAFGPKPLESITRQQGVFDTLGSRVRLDEGDAVWWYAPLAKTAEFHAGVEGLADLWVVSDDAEPKKYESNQGKFKVNLEEWATKTVRIGLVARGTATLTRPRIDVPRADPTSKPKEPKYVFVWLAEGLRADHLSAYDASATVETPNYDDFAASAVVFERAFAQAGEPSSSLATLFTGAYPSRHGVTSAEGEVDDAIHVLAQPFRAVGFQTALFLAHRSPTTGRGLTRGFDHVVVPDETEGTRPMEKVWADAESWLEGHPAPAFVMAGPSETTPPLDAPSTLLSKYAEGPAPASMKTTNGSIFDAIAAGEKSLNESEKKHLRAMYRAAVTQNDLWFGSALETLDKLGIRDDTLIVVTAPVGLALGEDGAFGYGEPTDGTVRVPLMIQHRAWRRDGSRVAETVELVDLYETLVELAELGRLESDHLQGESLRELLFDPTVRHQRPTFAYRGDEVAAVRLGDRLFQPGEAETLERIGDPPQYARESIPPGDSIAWRMMRDFTPFHLRWGDRWDKSKWGHPNNHSEDAARELDREVW